MMNPLDTSANTKPASRIVLLTLSLRNPHSQEGMSDHVLSGIQPRKVRLDSLY